MKFDTRKNVALLAYLAVTKSPHSRESLTTLLWPDMEPSRARSGLRRNLSILRKTLGDRWLQVDRESVALELSEDSWFDMDNFHYLLTAWKEHGHLGTEVCARCLPSLEEAVELYRGDFLEGFILRDNPNFDEWQFFQAEGLRRELASALEHLVMGYTAQEEFDLAILYARRWLALDNLRESVQRTLMRLYTWSGQRAAALRQYIEYERLLKQELGLTAEEETTQLYQTIREKGELSPPESHLVPFRPTHITLNERYQLEDEISSGGAGRVYSAYDNLLDREVVVKLYSDTTLGSEGRNHLLKEAQAAARLNHPNIVAIYDACEVDSTFFIVMERVEGITLAEWEPASLEEILKITRQICTGLSHAHTNGIIHRDLKPENILLGVDGIIKLTDFGLARSIATRLTSEGIITGTVFYLAPELALGQDFDGRADLYALGVMLYEFVTNQLPFSADDPIAVISQHIHAPVVPPRALKAEIPPVLDALITSLLSKNPADRPISAEMVLAKLSTPDILDVEASPVEELTLLNRIGRGRLVGRDEELQICRGYWSRALASQGQLLLISGEAGIGKTRLVRELETLAEISGGWVLKGACYAEGGVPYSPFTQIIRQAFEKGFIEDFDIPSFVLADLLVLAPVLRLKYTMTKTEQAPVDPKSEQQQLFENLAIFINLLSDQAPLLLILEDLHWADSSTLCLMRHLARQTLGRRAMIVATYRHTEVGELHPIHPVLLDLHREGLLSQLLLPRLDREQTEKLLATMFAQEVPAVFLDGIYRETEGNPFFIEEVCKSLMDRGKVYYEDGRWRGRRMEEMEIPQSVRVAIQSRVGVLPLISQQQLRLAAVVGREFEFDTLAKASNQDEEILIEALDNAERAQLIGYVSDVGGGSYTFVHTLIPATLVESARPLQRRRLHHQVAAAIEALYPDNYEALAYQYQQAGKAEKAAGYSLLAGDRARGLYAYQEAIAHYQAALQSLKKREDFEQAARTLMKLGLTYHNTFDFRAARQSYEEGFAFWQRIASSQSQSPGLPAPHPLRVTAFEPSSLGPGIALDLPSAVMIDQLFSGLVEVSPEMSVIPDIALSWQVMEGGCKYVFHLRDDVFWSDGVPVTAGDIHYACMRVLDPSRSYKAATMLYDIQGARDYNQGKLEDPQQVGVRVVDDYTLVLELEGPTSYFPYILSFSPMFPIPRHLAQAHGDHWADVDHIVTNGPFRLVSWEPGESMILERNPKYHGHFSGNIQQVECSFISGKESQYLQLYEQDRLDICSGLSPVEWYRVRQRHADEYVSAPWLSIDFIGFNVNQPPFNDPHVRQAFCLATDQETLAEVILHGYAFPATGGLVPLGMPGHSAGIGLPYDPGLARRLLAEAGYPNGQNFPSIHGLARDDPGHDLLCEYLEEQWLEILGIEIHWELVAWANFPARMSRATPSLWMTGYWVDYPDPEDILRVMWWFPPGWQNAAFDQLVAIAQRAVDQEERVRIYQQADRVLVDDAPLLPLCYGRTHTLVKPWVRKYVSSPQKWWYWKDVVIESHS